MAGKFRSFYIEHIRHGQNTHADVLTPLTASLVPPAKMPEKVLSFTHDLYCPKSALRNESTTTEDLKTVEALETSTCFEIRVWQFLYIDYTLFTILPEDPKEMTTIKKNANRFTIMPRYILFIVDF